MRQAVAGMHAQTSSEAQLNGVRDVKAQGICSKTLKACLQGAALSVSRPADMVLACLR